MNIEKARFNMIEQQVRPWEVLDERVLTTMNKIPREKFVPQEYKNVAFADIEIPLGHNQVMMPPKLEGRLLQSLNLKPQDRVLEIGTGSGYLTACLASLAASVVTIEYFSDLSQNASQHLQDMGFNNIDFRVGNAAEGWDEHGSFDVIAVTGSLLEPDRHFHKLLRNQGRLFVIIGQAPVMEAQLITRITDKQIITESLFETSIPPLETLTIKKEFEF